MTYHYAIFAVDFSQAPWFTTNMNNINNVYSTTWTCISMLKKCCHSKLQSTLLLLLTVYEMSCTEIGIYLNHNIVLRTYRTNQYMMILLILFLQSITVYLLIIAVPVNFEKKMNWSSLFVISLTPPALPVLIISSRQR